MPIRIEHDAHGGYVLHIGYRTDIRLSNDEARILLTTLSRELSAPKPGAVSPAKARVIRN